ncbi:hypothetical protein DFH08DRAFT_898778 [Mycena albidolilacea]|uniref:Uncharacterized protein n=1 Tax=Mycena albidolilacea TaxID=1033008 RepID=A0AAD6Z6I3_9AGAR|nr:hypothetical protein DFH08DRAFT_898778 [Mycena albidolilacea]
MREPIAAKQRRRSSGNWAVWAAAAMRSTRVALSTSRTPSASRYFSARMSSGLLSSPTDWDLERVLSAIRASVLEAPATPGMGTRLRLLLSPFDALLNAQQLYMAHSTPPVHQRHRPYPSRPHQWTIRAPDDRRSVPPPVASIRLSTMVSPSTCRFLRMSCLHLRATPVPQINDASPAVPSAGPAHSPLEPASYNTSPKRSTRGKKYARCVQRAGRIRHAHHVPPTSTAAFSPTSRAGLSRSCDPSPRHVQATAQQTKTVRKHRVAWMGIESPPRSREEMRGSCITCEGCGRSNRERTRCS